MKKSILKLLTLSAILLSGCRSPLSTVSAVVDKRITSQTERDSTYVRDSVRWEYRRGTIQFSNFSSTHLHNCASVRSPDTVYVERWHTRWRERIVQRTDTMLIDNSHTETLQVRYVPRFYKICTALTALGLLLFLLRVMLRLRHR